MYVQWQRSQLWLLWLPTVFVLVLVYITACVQVMPQLLSLMELDVEDPNSPDW
jgi:hypothetical protein